MSGKAQKKGGKKKPSEEQKTEQTPTPIPERKTGSDEGKMYVVKNSDGECVKIASTLTQATEFIGQRRFREALEAVYGEGAYDKFQSAIVLPIDALKKVFGSDAMERVDEKGNTIVYTVETVSCDDLCRAAQKV